MGGVGEDLGGKLIFIMTFLGVFIILVSTIPSGFLAEAPGYRDISIPEQFEAFDVPVYKYQTFNIAWTGEGSYWIDFDFDNHAVPFAYRFTAWNTTNNYDYDACVFFIEWTLYPFEGLSLYFWVENENEGHTLTFDQLDTIYNETETLFFSMKTEDTSQLRFLAAFHWNETLYSMPSEALENEDITLYVGLTWEQELSAMSAWNLIPMILFFQLPGVHPILNLIIGLPIWVCIGYIIVRLILLALPFVG